MIVDIRRYPGDFWVNELVDASVIKKKWWGKRIDNYWRFLDNNTNKLEVEFDAHLFADVFAYLYDKLKFEELMTKYSDRLTKNRGTFVVILVFEDKERLLPIISTDNFLPDLITYAKELNAEFYNYTDDLVENTVTRLKLTLEVIDDNDSLLINIG